MCCGAERQRQHPPGPGGIRELTGASLGPCADLIDALLQCDLVVGRPQLSAGRTGCDKSEAACG